MINILRDANDGLLGESRPELSRLVNWRGGGGLPIHRWFRYREGFSPSLITELGLGQRILDPFCGSGSIMIGAAQQDRSSVGIDVNPLAAFVARVKLSPLSTAGIRQARRFLSLIDGQVEHAAPAPLPDLRIARKVFEPAILETILRLKRLIDDYASDDSLADFLLLAWLSILEEVGSYFKEGNGIKYRNRKRTGSGYVARPDGKWQVDRFGSDQRDFALASFKSRLDTMLADVPAWKDGAWSSQQIIEGDSLEQVHRLPEGSFDSVIFSPPYANRFDYFESQKVELWFGGFVTSYGEMTSLRKRSVRSHLGAALNGDTAPLEEVDDLIDLMDPESYAMRTRVPALIRGYFRDMQAILTASRRVLRDGGSCFVVVGNSAYAGVIIPTDSFIARIGRSVGFGSASVVPVRHLTVAPQQRNELRGCEEYMRESIVVLS